MKHISMQKLLCAVCTAALTAGLVGALSVSAENSVPVQLMGDLNGDMRIDVSDAQSALNLYVDSLGKHSVNTANAATGVADINMDGVIGVDDANSILQYYCQTLVGGHPLWAEIRSVSYADGTDFYARFETDDEGNPVLDETGQPVLVGPNVDSPFPLTGLYIELGCASGAPGESVTVPVYVAGLPKLAGFQLLIGHELPLELTEIIPTLQDHPDLERHRYDVGGNPRFDENHGCVVMAQAHDLALTDGYVISEFVYQIPEDAQPGDYYALNVESYYTKFITAQCSAYQYTALSGVVMVE